MPRQPLCLAHSPVCSPGKAVVTPKGKETRLKALKPGKEKLATQSEGCTDHDHCPSRSDGAIPSPVTFQTLHGTGI